MRGVGGERRSGVKEGAALHASRAAAFPLRPRNNDAAWFCPTDPVVAG